MKRLMKLSNLSREKVSNTLMFRSMMMMVGSLTKIFSFNFMMSTVFNSLERTLGQKSLFLMMTSLVKLHLKKKNRLRLLQLKNTQKL